MKHKLYQLSKPKLLIIDEFSYTPFSPSAVPLLFRLIYSQYKQKSILILFVEYKGENLYSNADNSMKRLSGEIWEEHNKGKVLFLMATKDKNSRNVRQQIEDKILKG